MTKHAGRALRAALRIVFWTLVLVLAVLAAGALVILISQWITTLAQHWKLIAGSLLGLWILFTAFTLYFFRDPKPLESGLGHVIVAPASGKVDVIDETTEAEFLGAPCQRISIFLSILDVHVQRAPLAGRLVYLQHRPGKFLSATRTHSAEHNESVLLGFEVKDRPTTKVAVRLIAGLLARRILTWIKLEEETARSERISLIQFGSRCELYLPREAKLQVKLGDKVKAGETIVASWEESV